MSAHLRFHIVTRNTFISFPVLPPTTTNYPATRPMVHIPRDRDSTTDGSHANVFDDATPLPLPLIQAISENRAVAFVGAGASIPVGLPKWRMFIESCLELAKASAKEPADGWRFTESLIQQGDLVTAAELLHESLGTELEKEFYRVFGNAQEPSVVHHAIARIPFSLAITTNFDLLMEAAYPSPVFPFPAAVHSWRDPDAFFSAIKNHRFAIVKTHGVVGNGPSLVLTRTQYRNLVNRNDLFNSCMRILLSLRTFLFIGASLAIPTCSN